MAVRGRCRLERCGKRYIKTAPNQRHCCPEHQQEAHREAKREWWARNAKAQNRARRVTTRKAKKAKLRKRAA